MANDKRKIFKGGSHENETLENKNLEKIKKNVINTADYLVRENKL